MSVVTDWASAIAAGLAAFAAFKSLEVARAAAKTVEDSRHSAALREWRQTNASVIAEGGGCLAAIALLVPSIDSTFKMAGAFDGSAHKEMREKVAGIRESITVVVGGVTQLRSKSAGMGDASIGDMDAAVAKAHERLVAVRMAADQCEKLQARMDADRLMYQDAGH